MNSSLRSFSRCRFARLADQIAPWPRRAWPCPSLYVSSPELPLWDRTVLPCPSPGEDRCQRLLFPPKRGKQCDNSKSDQSNKKDWGVGLCPYMYKDAALSLTLLPISTKPVISRRRAGEATGLVGDRHDRQVLGHDGRHQLRPRCTCCPRATMPCLPSPLFWRQALSVRSSVVPATWANLVTSTQRSRDNDKNAGDDAYLRRYRQRRQAQAADAGALSTDGHARQLS